MNNDTLSQMESKMVSEWLRSEYQLRITNSLMFWRQRPTSIADRVVRDWKVKVTPQDITAAAGRSEN